MYNHIYSIVEDFVKAVEQENLKNSKELVELANSGRFIYAAIRLHCREQTFPGLLVSVRGTPGPGCPPPLPALDGTPGKPFSASGRPCPFAL